MTLITLLLLLSNTCEVCKDRSCTGNRRSCREANIDYVVGPSCRQSDSCRSARIGSVDSSCTSFGSCTNARLSGVDLINSCNEVRACGGNIDGNGEIAELINCCNDESEQCRGEVGRIEIVAAGGSSCVSLTCQTSDKLLLHLSNDSLFSHS